jgi:hypothetical protein
MSDLDDKDFAIRAPYIQEILRLNAEVAMLSMTGESVVARWDSPLWKDAPATAIFINELRHALAASASDWLTAHDAKVIAPLAKAICYPEHWDIACYPTLLDALNEIGCSVCRDPEAHGIYPMEIPR